MKKINKLSMNGFFEATWVKKKVPAVFIEIQQGNKSP